MLTLSLIFAGLAAALHVYIFVLESVLWTRPSTRAVFGIDDEDQARALAPMAFNQGFYNLFLAMIAAAGVIATAMGEHAVGAALIVAGVGSMLAAAIVLVAHDRTQASAALKQGTLPALALVTLAISLL
ncbi:DUF1304 domain-containing protein [Demequina sp.]|uniref:DUF1304 domain-containing protein n=1 Tax=Demequina sp. TaxID=2050685 RepID=UPI003A86F4ED